MSAARLIKFSPTAILLAYLGYASFSLQAALPGAADQEAALARGLEQTLKELVATESVAADAASRLRNPFLAVRQPVPDAAEPEASADPASDRLAEIIAGLSLDATFLQGRDQLAIINGRIYHKGQKLALPGHDDSMPPVLVLFVKPTGVILSGGGKNYLLGYPEQFHKKPAADAEADPAPVSAESDPAGQAAMFQRLLNSPLGALGKSLIGDAVTPKHAGQSRSGGRRPQGETGSPTP